MMPQLLLELSKAQAISLLSPYVFYFSPCVYFLGMYVIFRVCDCLVEQALPHSKTRSIGDVHLAILP